MKYTPLLCDSVHGCVLMWRLKRHVFRLDKKNQLEDFYTTCGTGSSTMRVRSATSRVLHGIAFFGVVDVITDISDPIWNKCRRPSVRCQCACPCQNENVNVNVNYTSQKQIQKTVSMCISKSNVHSRMEKTALLRFPRGSRRKPHHFQVLVLLLQAAKPCLLVARLQILVLEFPLRAANPRLARGLLPRLRLSARHQAKLCHP